MKKHVLSVLIFIGLMSSGFSQVGSNLLSTLSRPPLFGASPFQDSLWAFDTTFHQVVYASGPSPSSGGSITGINGMTMHPHTGELFVVCKQSAVLGRMLGKYNIFTGVVTIIGNLGDNFSSISFREDGQLFGVTGDGATVPETMFLINTSTAGTTVAATLGAGADGEVIAFNHDDDFFYHWSGNGTVVYEKIMSVAPYTTTNIPIIGTTNGETFGAVYLGSNKFRISNIGSAFNHCFTSGQWSTQFGSTPDDIRGLGLVGRWVDRPGNDTICSNDSSLFEAFATTGVPDRHKFQWVKDGVNIPGATASTYYANQTGWYNCRIILDTLFSNGQTMDSTITVYTDTAWYGRHLQVLNTPVVTLNPTPIGYLCDPGDSILLTGSAGGTSQWYYNGGIIIGANTNTYSTNAPGVYNMIKTNMNGCSDSAAVGTTIIFAPAISLSSGGDVCFGDSVALTATAGSATYNWLDGGTFFTSTASETLFATSSGNYSVETTFGDCIDTSSISVVNVAPEYTLTPNGTGTICMGTGILLTATSGGSSYQWLNDGSPMPGANADTVTVFATGNYSAVITFPGCTDTSVTSFDLTVIDCSGIAETTASTLHVYPNPATEFLQISSEMEVMTIQIIDQLGRVLKTSNNNGINPIIAIDNLKSGMYFITIVTDEGIQSARFIKN